MDTPNMVSAIFTAIGNAITAFAGILGNAFSSMVSLFWNGTALTDVGVLLLIGAGVGLVWGAFAFIRALVRVRAR